MYKGWNKISDVTKEDLSDYWKRKNRFIIIKLNENNFLVCLVEDKPHPDIPGYPASSIEYFSNSCQAKKAIKTHYKNINYYPKY